MDVRLDGSRPCDIKLNDDRALSSTMSRGSLGLGEAYMDGWWDCEAPDQLFDRILSGRIHRKVRLNANFVVQVVKARLLNMQSRRKSLEVAEVHYNLGNDFYEAMLDPWMQYTCGYWQGGAKTLEEAQEAKLDLVCRKLDLKPGERVLELGCGWGGFARFAASRYGVEVVAYNISVEQVAWAREKCAGLPVDIRLSDYRDATGEFDKAVSIGMCEHVGWRNLKPFCKLVHDRLKPDGVFLLHTIGGFEISRELDAWMDRYIFPGAFMPSPVQIAGAFDKHFILEDWHNFGVDYDRTLMAWNENFEAAWPRFSEKYGDRFHRMWRYYLLSCAGTFRSRYNQLFQLVLSKRGIRGGWKTTR